MGRQIGYRVTWQKEDVFRLLDLIKNTPSWHYHLFKEGYVGHPRAYVTKQICLAMFSEDEAWVKEMSKEGLIQSINEEFVATRKWLENEYDPVQRKLLSMSQELSEDVIEVVYDVYSDDWATWNDIPFTPRNRIRAHHPYYFLYRSLQKSKPRRTPLPGKPDIQTAINELEQYRAEKRRAKRRGSERESTGNSTQDPIQVVLPTPVSTQKRQRVPTSDDGQRSKRQRGGIDTSAIDTRVCERSSVISSADLELIEEDRGEGPSRWDRQELVPADSELSSRPALVSAHNSCDDSNVGDPSPPYKSGKDKGKKRRRSSPPLSLRPSASKPQRRKPKALKDSRADGSKQGAASMPGSCSALETRQASAADEPLVPLDFGTGTHLAIDQGSSHTNLTPERHSTSATGNGFASAEMDPHTLSSQTSSSALAGPLPTWRCRSPTPPRRGSDLTGFLSEDISDWLLRPALNLSYDDDPDVILQEARKSPFNIRHSHLRQRLASNDISTDDAIHLSYFRSLLSAYIAKTKSPHDMWKGFGKTRVFLEGVEGDQVSSLAGHISRISTWLGVQVVDSLSDLIKGQPRLQRYVVSFGNTVYPLSVLKEPQGNDTALFKMSPYMFLRMLDNRYFCLRKERTPATLEWLGTLYAEPAQTALLFHKMWYDCYTSKNTQSRREHILEESKVISHEWNVEAFFGLLRDQTIHVYDERGIIKRNDNSLSRNQACIMRKTVLHRSLKKMLAAPNAVIRFHVAIDVRGDMNVVSKKGVEYQKGSYMDFLETVRKEAERLVYVAEAKVPSRSIEGIPMEVDELDDIASVVADSVIGYIDEEIAATGEVNRTSKVQEGIELDEGKGKAVDKGKQFEEKHDVKKKKMVDVKEKKIQIQVEAKATEKSKTTGENKATGKNMATEENKAKEQPRAHKGKANAEESKTGLEVVEHIRTKGEPCHSARDVKKVGETSQSAKSGIIDKRADSRSSKTLLSVGKEQKSSIKKTVPVSTIALLSPPASSSSTSSVLTPKSAPSTTVAAASPSTSVSTSTRSIGHPRTIRDMIDRPAPDNVSLQNDAIFRAIGKLPLDNMEIALQKRIKADTITLDQARLILEVRCYLARFAKDLPGSKFAGIFKGYRFCLQDKDGKYLDSYSWAGDLKRLIQVHGGTICEDMSELKKGDDSELRLAIQLKQPLEPVKSTTSGIGRNVYRQISVPTLFRLLRHLRCRLLLHDRHRPELNFRLAALSTARQEKCRDNRYLTGTEWLDVEAGVTSAWASARLRMLVEAYELLAGKMTDHTSQKISVFFDESGFRHDPSQLAVFRKAKAHIEYSGILVVDTLEALYGVKGPNRRIHVDRLVDTRPLACLGQDCQPHRESLLQFLLRVDDFCKEAVFERDMGRQGPSRYR